MASYYIMLLLLCTHVTNNDSWMIQTRLGNNYRKSSIAFARLKTQVHTHMVLARDHLPWRLDTAGNRIIDQWGGGDSVVIRYFVHMNKFHSNLSKHNFFAFHR